MPERPPTDLRAARRAELTVAIEELDPIARREFFARMGATLALAGLSGCTRAPREEIVPYVVQPPEIMPGRPRTYATALAPDGYAVGLLVETHEGRPTKVEGNPEHPASLGGAGAREQASLATLYDASRAQACKEGARIVPWSAIARGLKSGRWREREGRGLHLVLAPTSSPTVARLLEALREACPHARVTFSTSPAKRNAWEGTRAAFGRVVEPRFDLAETDVILSLDADVLARGPSHLRLSRAYAERRTGERDVPAMNRLYVVEPLVSLTGAAADHRLAVKSADVVAIAARLALTIGAWPNADELAAIARSAEPHRLWVDAVARDLVAHRGRSLVVAGDDQPPLVHALAHAVNAKLGNVGTTVDFAPSPIVDAGAPSHGMVPLLQALDAGEVETLIVASNVAYASPATLDLARHLPRARERIYIGEHDDETSAFCTHFVARAHDFECWSDARAFDGTLSVAQPLLQPLYDGRSLLDVLAVLVGRETASAYDLVRETFSVATASTAGPTRGRSDDVDRALRSALKKGFIDRTAFERTEVRIDEAAVAHLVRDEARRISAATARRVDVTEARFELVTRPDPSLHDGSTAPNAWLLELPSPITSLTWTNAATISPTTARALGLASGDEVELRSNGGRVIAPACVVPGQADGTVGLTLGWGRTMGPEVARGRGANAYALGAEERGEVVVTKTGRTRDLATTQPHRSLEGRDASIARHATRDEAASTPPRKKPLSLYEPTSDRGSAREPRWAMAVDLSRCTGCGACVVACQAENNVPTVGEVGVAKGRAMHWLRVDRYEVGDADAPARVFQPMLCQHCEKAPCEYVCPVNATVHSDDGLNAMVYNRCVGTRFCSNNCPYKVRRFNWFDFHRDESPVEQLVHNPNVTVRERGVMEKCSFCVQRLRAHEIRRERGEKPPPVQTACQQTCPSGAIVFGDLRDETSPVAHLHRSARAYAALDELGTSPRIRYLTRLKNPNPELA